MGKINMKAKKESIILIHAIIIMSLGYITGCSKSHLQLAFESIDQNEYLSQDEKAFAKRCYLHVSEHYHFYNWEEHKEYPDVTTQILDSRMYAVWGLGPVRDFNDVDRAYIGNIDNFNKIWEEYTYLNMSELASYEIDFLKKVHENYGSNPSFEDYMNVGREWFWKMDFENFYVYELARDWIQYILNIDHVDDFSIILLHRLERRMLF